ncbi:MULTISPECIES: DNA translocase FtsK [Delftia]|uniref:DNA translocase FtsK n=1 Tax=Delftia TaxID=80865 RepID=UPI0005C1AC52|nr:MULTISPECIES: DNA translocase FtsK [Delftia]MBK0112526.1 DNA translocase FtsK 4TM domain-containing protein [Delftia sp. S65]MBK0117939.1 DNA translocase FtsK 4TM domain-containing protein [Delftia sp. S67]MBK0131257.1 DNA translocase FtsK 4TM domain-containing protein [Delftia sp. S66]MCG3782052.1 DNA translocase FtsK 4TM domain-containing protein [Delftia acidovorans]MCG8987569.1 DNA translocase FtsK 4TM domain-containing protein [Delftia acidovorans]
MTYSLNALNASTSAKGKSRSAARPGMVARFGHEMLLLAGLLALVFWLASMLSYSPQDPAWSTSGAGHARLVANWMGRVGAWLADACYFGFGMSVWWLVLASLQTWLSSFARWLRGGVPRDGVPLPPLWRRRLRFWGGLLLLLGASCALEWTRLYRFESVLPGPAGGVFGYMLGYHSLQWLGFMGSGLIGICVAVIGLAMVFRFSWGHLAESMGARLDGWVLFLFARREKARDEAAGRRAAREREEVVQEERTESAVQHPQPVQIIEPVLQEAAIPSVRVVKERQKPLFSELPDSKLPQVDLLDAAQQRQESVSPETLEMTSRLIEKRLKDFGVDVHVVAAMPGPVITRYEIEPATGVKGSQIVNLAKDLARSLSLVSIRVIETIPGKNFMALELPNAKRQSIRLSEVLGSQVYHDAKSMLTMGLGKDIVGNPVVADLAKMPHVLVAGTTGSGKSVGINAMILSLLYKAEARDVRLLMIDPKMLEMSVYEGIPHLLCPVVTDMKQAANGLNWCVAEMERRYKLMSKLGVRNLAGYNTKIDEAKAREESIPNPFSLTPEEPEPLQRLPHIVIVIDELADLMMVVGKKIEELIARLAQKARAAGIHLILATQRPSVDVITGLIKANIPTRIAFQVSSKIDSRTVLDQMGAESLLGMGDMLYMASGTGLPVRVHGAFVSDEEVHRVVGYLKEQGEADYIEGVLEGGTAEGDSEFGSESGDGGNGEKDPMYDQAVEVVLKDRKASISYVQRKLRIGYNRSARLLEDMEKAGLVSGLTASGQREVLVPARAGE